MEKAGYVYIMASKKNGTIYIGVTSDLVKRVWEHREGAIFGFTRNTVASCWCGSKFMKICRKRVTASYR